MPLPLLAITSPFWSTAAAWLTRIFMSRGGQMVVGTLAALGLSMSSNAFVIEPILQRIISASSGLTPDALAWISYLGFDEFITTILSAYAAASALGYMRMKMNPAVGGGTGY